tara:strand:- start:1441 stop:1596 length:156 start_codon:yes stop_codon:yes gene_type:complete
MERSILKKKWIRKWRWEIAAQIHKDFLVGRRKGSTSKEFKLYVKNFTTKGG